jgi:hypothetical protein
MKVDPQILSLIEKLSLRQRGIFTTQGLKNLFQIYDISSLNQKIRPYLEAKILQRFCRGYYVTKNFSLVDLSQRISPRSVISFGNVLAKELIIGSIPQKRTYAIKTGKSRTYTSHLGSITHLGLTIPLAKDLVTLGSHWDNGICYADKEKALLDVCYFYQRGHKFSFSIYSDIDYSLFDKRKVKKYLQHYKNPKFQQFVLGVLHG